MTKKTNTAGDILWGISTVIAGFISFLLFLGGISGTGNDDLINAAYWVWAIPSIIKGVLSFLSALFNYYVSENLDAAKIKKDEIEITNPAIGIAGRKIIKTFALIIIVSIPAYFLIMYGIDVYEEQQSKDSALFMEIRKGILADPIIIKQLLNEGEDPNQRSRFGATPLMSALEFLSMEKSDEIIELLLDYGADTNQQSVLYRDASRRDKSLKLKEYLPIHLVISKTGSSVELLTLMIKKGLNVNPEIKSVSDRSPLIAAIKRSGPGGYKKAELLLSVGADVTLPENQMALQYASQQHNEYIVNMLLNEPVSIEAITESIDLVEIFMRERYCNPYSPVVLRKLKDEANRRLGESQFVNHYSFKSKPVKVSGQINFSERELTVPLPVLAIGSNRIYLRGYYYSSPSNKGKLVGNLSEETLVDVLAITDNRWYKIKLENGDIGYMHYNGLKPYKICLEGIR